MGHANLTNISEFFLQRLHTNGKMSVRECVDAMIKVGETVHASEGEYEDEYMLSYALEEVIGYLLKYREKNGKRGRKSSPVIEVVEPISDEQENVLAQWLEEGEGDDWDVKEFAILDSIQWQYCENWRERYEEVKTLGNVTN